ncbi:MAG: MFS transporter [Dongiaceae bacterium]
MPGTTADAASTSGSVGSSKWMLAGWYGLFVLIMAMIIGSVNTSIIALVSESIKKSLSISDAQIGMINGLALTLATAAATIPMGWLADRVDRRWLLAVCVGIWSASTFAFGQATTFPTMFLFAMGIAVGEAVLGPVVYSIIPDLFPREKWIIANFIFYVCVLLGSYAGFAISGSLLTYVDANRSSLPTFMADLESWRAALMVCAALGPILMALILVMRLHRKTSSAAAAGKVMGLYDFFRDHARTLAGVFFGFGLSYAAFGAQSRWNAVLLQRIFGESQADIGSTIGLIGGSAALTGVAVSWLLVRWLKPKHGENAPMLVAQFGLLMGLLVSLALPFVESASQYYAVIAVKVMFTTAAMSLSPAVLQFIAPAHMRGRVVAVGGMVTVIFASFMPYFIGLLSDQVFTGPKAILWAMCAIIIPALLIGLLFLRYGAKTLPGTIRAAQGASP